MNAVETPVAGESRRASVQCHSQLQMENQAAAKLHSLDKMICIDVNQQHHLSGVQQDSVQQQTQQRDSSYLQAALWRSACLQT